MSFSVRKAVDPPTTAYLIELFISVEKVYCSEQEAGEPTEGRKETITVVFNIGNLV